MNYAEEIEQLKGKLVEEATQGFTTTGKAMRAMDAACALALLEGQRQQYEKALGALEEQKKLRLANAFRAAGTPLQEEMEMKYNVVQCDIDALAPLSPGEEGK